MGTKLVYHTQASQSGGISPFDEAIHEVSNGEELLIACPYIDVGYIAPFLSKQKDWRIISDVEAWLSTFQGNSRDKIIRLITENKSRVHHYKNLHAKVILGNNLCLFGSANFTRMGVTERVEMSVLVEDVSYINEIHEWFDNLWLCSGEVDLKELENYAQNSIKETLQIGKDDVHLTSKSPIIRAKTSVEFADQASKVSSEVSQKNDLSRRERKVYRNSDFDQNF